MAVSSFAVLPPFGHSSTTERSSSSSSSYSSSKLLRIPQYRFRSNSRCSNVFVSSSESTVDLVSTIHIADKEYFTTLQKELEPYDSILYEMRQMARVLTLDFQLDCLDENENWYHADLDLETFQLLQ
ncbi:hypothetical protein ISN45_Un33g000010, partial [Arabidopsis thaliana x Arabidopsis arenosa]